MRSTSIGAALALAAAAALAACAGADPPGSGYVALGSSFAAGPALEPVADADCHRSQVNYPHLAAEALDLPLLDVSCTGTSADNVGVQIESVTERTRLVTLTLGGNDVGYAVALDDYACLDIGLCETDTVDPAALDDSLATVADLLVTVLQEIRAVAPQAPLLLVGYPRIVPPDGETCPEMPLTPEHAQTLRSVGDRLDAAFRDAAARGGAELVDVYAASPELGVCEPVDPWVDGLAPGTAPSGTFPFHPTAAGMAAVADLVVRTVRAPA